MTRFLSLRNQRKTDQELKSSPFTSQSKFHLFHNILTYHITNENIEFKMEFSLSDVFSVKTMQKRTYLMISYVEGVIDSLDSLIAEEETLYMTRCKLCWREAPVSLPTDSLRESPKVVLSLCNQRKMKIPLDIMSFNSEIHLAKTTSYI
ncbi:unnamed protein product [Rhizophagus irregularis]|nr:unnamed protein product [Rhizophagus irregularis]